MNKIAVLIVRLWNWRMNIEIGGFLFRKFMSNTQQTDDGLIIIQTLELALKLWILKQLIDHVCVESTTRLPIVNKRQLLLLELILLSCIFLTGSAIVRPAIVAIQSALVVVSLRISASSPSRFHLWLLLRNLKSRYVVVAIDMIDRRNCKTGEDWIRKAWWVPLVLVVGVCYWQVLVIYWDSRHHTIIWYTMHTKLVYWTSHRNKFRLINWAFLNERIKGDIDLAVPLFGLPDDLVFFDLSPF